MESVEEGVDHNGSNDEQFAAAASAVVRGKRTRRQRLLAVSAAPASPAEASSSAEEDEDMANCLILLAQGGASRTAGAAKVAADAYRCKTCDKTFASFQALGGHRTSHKKPKTAAPLLDHEKKPAAEDETEGLSITAEDSIPKPVTTTSSNDENIVAAAASGASAKQRVHECSICGSEFSSGQALGGHMRRHRPLAPEVKKEKNIFLLDLNLPAPADDDDSEIAMAFPFESRQPPPLIFSASSLVDCHY